MPYIYIICSDCGSPGKKLSKSQFPSLCPPCAQRESKRKYGEIHREELLQARYAWRKANPEEHNAARRAMYAKNPEPHRKRAREWNKAHPEQQRERCREWNAENPQPARKRALEWQKLHPDKANARNQRRRARKHGALGQYTDAEWNAVVKQQGGKCIDCGFKGKLTVGHLIPLAKGGSNYITNIVGQCLQCNCKQHVKIHPKATPSLFDKLINF